MEGESWRGFSFTKNDDVTVDRAIKRGNFYSRGVTRLGALAEPDWKALLDTEKPPRDSVLEDVLGDLTFAPPSRTRDNATCRLAVAAIFLAINFYDGCYF